MDIIMNFSIYTVMMWFILLAMRRTPRCLNCCLLSIYRLFLAWCGSRINYACLLFSKSWHAKGMDIVFLKRFYRRRLMINIFLFMLGRNSLSGLCNSCSDFCIPSFFSLCFFRLLCLFGSFFFCLFFIFCSGFLWYWLFLWWFVFFLYRLLWITVECCFPHCAFP